MVVADVHVHLIISLIVVIVHSSENATIFDLNEHSNGQFQNVSIASKDVIGFMEKDFNVSNQNVSESVAAKFLEVPGVSSHADSKQNLRNDNPEKTVQVKFGDPTEHFQQQMQLDIDGNYIVFWSHNATDIIFEVHVRTYGYIGFGFSHFGGMFPGDVVIGGVKDGTSYFKDYYTTENDQPKLDNSQDWALLHAEENEFGTILKFTRLLQTCDEHDREITNQTMHVIYAFHEEDVSAAGRVVYHGYLKRGSKVINLLNRKQEKRISTSESFYFTGNNKTIIPAGDTYYHCEMFQIPDLGRRHHFTRFSPVIQPENRRYIHHMVLYACKNLEYNQNGHTFECMSNVYLAERCSHKYAVTAAGHHESILPEHVGISVGGADDTRYFMLAIHFNKITPTQGITDTSGFRAEYTPNLRRYSGGILVAGLEWTRLSVLPPHFESLVTPGVCSPHCLERAMTKGSNSFNVVAVGQHTHLLGRSIITRHIRRGTELRPLANETNFNFNNQGITVLENEVTVRRGDSIRVDCTYDTSQMKTTVRGGRSTHQEMCVSFILYYPKMDLDQCFGFPVYNHIARTTLAISSIVKSWDFRKTSVREKFQNELTESDYWTVCKLSDNLVPIPARTKFPTIEHPYRMPQVQCVKSR
ncbi:hypothetical protein ScPMuIL_013792 [Solemya velum]